MLRPFAEWLATTPLSVMLQNALWVVPTSQSIHILSLGTLFASATMINLRLLGVGASGRSVSQLAATLVPWIWRALVLLAFTGAVQTITEPVRQFITPIFWLKMAMIIVVAIWTAWFARTVRDNAARWDSPTARPGSARLFAVGSTLLWMAIVVCGRFIGYVWAFYV